MEQNKIESVAKALAQRKGHPADRTSEGRTGSLVVIDRKSSVCDNTTLLLYMVKIQAVDGQSPAAFFSLGMPNIEVVNRLLSVTTGIDLQKITDGTLSDEEWERLDERLPELADAPLYIDDTPELAFAELNGRLADLAACGVGFVVVDHAQLLAGGGQDAGIHHAIAAVRAVAESLGITIVAVVD